MMPKKIAPTALAVGVSLIIAGCGGGGGGGGGYVQPTPVVNPYLRTEVPFSTPIKTVTVDPLVVSDPWRITRGHSTVENITGPNKQDLLIWGHQEPIGNENVAWSNSRLSMLSIQDGTLKDVTSTWFPNGINETYGILSLRAGDLNGKGRNDLLVVTGDDTNLRSEVLIYSNNGSNFTRQTITLPKPIIGHDATIADIDKDGRQDAIITSFNPNTTFLFNNGNGSFTPYVQKNTVLYNSSSVVVADFLGNNTTTMIFTDPLGAGSTAQLYGWSKNGGDFNLNLISTMPTPRFLLPKWAEYNFGFGPNLGQGASHEIRVLAKDFNRDGRVDAIIISRPTGPNGTWPEFSEVQFLKNQGNGVFVDVTDNVLVGYNTKTPASYNPRWIDLNGDGLDDLLLSGTSFTGYTATQFLLASQDGKFVAAHQNLLTDFIKQVNDLQGTVNAGNTVTVLKGSDNKLYLVSVIQHTNSTQTDRNISVYISDLGSQSVSTAQNAIDLIRQRWPYMTLPQANEMLARTSPSYLGAKLLDLDKLLNPIGVLGLSIDGRLDQRRPITGGIFAPGLRSDLLRNVIAVDELGRDFQVNLSKMAIDPNTALSRFSTISSNGTGTWTSRLISQEISYQKDMMAVGYDQNWTTGSTGKIPHTSDNWSYSISATQMYGSPWLGFSGSFGTLRSSLMLDTNVTYRWGEGFWAQGGIIQTSTDYDKGLVEKISPIYSAYATTGLKQGNLHVFTGIQPVILAGEIDLKLPSYVDNTGTLQYTNHQIKLHNPLVSFVGFEHKWNQRDNNFKLTAMADALSRYSINFRYTKQF